MSSTADVISYFLQALRAALDADDMPAANAALAPLGMYPEPWADEQEASYKRLYVAHRDRYVDAGSFDWGQTQMKEAHDKAFTRQPA